MVLQSDLITIGQHSANDIVLDDPEVSQHHAAIFLDSNNSYLIRDLSSKNHTWVNGKSGPIHLLQNGSQIKLGNTTLIWETKDDSPGYERAEVVIRKNGPIPRGKVVTPNFAPGRASQDETRLKQLYEIATAINSTLECDAVFQKIMDQVCGTLSVERAFIALQDETGNALDFRVVHTSPSAPDEPITVSSSMIRMVLRDGKPLLTHNALEDPRFKDKKSVLLYDIRSAACVPLKSGGKILGMLYLDNRSKAGTFTEADLDFLTALAHLAAIAITNSRLYEQVNRRKQSLEKELGWRDRILFCSNAMRQIMTKVRQVAPTDATVLICGESGTGKELIAREVHRLSNRAESPFVAINCAAIPENLAESEFFGICRGTATGVADREGFFERSQGGTLFLDEIGEMPLTQQAKLLRVLEERKISRVGATSRCTCRKPAPCDHTRINLDMRIIAATNKDLEQEVRKGTFRNDLYYRFNVFPIHIPPLRERHEDIPLLATFLFDAERKKLGKPVQEISYQAMQQLMKDPWNGNNIRQLRSVIQRAIISGLGKMLKPDDFESHLDPQEPSANQTLRQVTRQYIVKVLEECDGNKTKAAAILGISPATLYNKLNTYRIETVGSQEIRDRGDGN